MSVHRSDKSKGYYTPMSNRHLRDINLSLKAKGLLSLMLSLPDDWDYSAKGLATLCQEGRDSVESGLKELEREGYLLRRRIRSPNGCFSHIQYDIYEESLLKDRASAQPKRNKSEQDDSKQDSPVRKNHTQLNRDIQNTEKLKEKEDQNDAHRWRVRIENNIDYDTLAEKYGEEKIDHLVELMLEVVISENPYCLIAKEKLPREVVRSRMLKINSEQIEYVLDELDNTTGRIGNAKAYVLAALFNAPVNMDNQFQFEVNRDYPLNG